MNESVYHFNAAQEKDHWWFQGRRKIIQQALKKLNLYNATILEIGAGTGGNIPLLQQFGQVDVLEPSPIARKYLAGHEKVKLIDGGLPEGLPKDKQYDLIALFDVLEHIKEDRLSLKCLHQQLKPGGKLVLTVPAYQCLFGPHDQNHYHFRRYSAHVLQNRLAFAHFKTDRISYFNCLLSPLIALATLLEKRRGKAVARDKKPSRIVNTILRGIFSFEALLLKLGNLPFGISILAIVSSDE